MSVRAGRRPCPAWSQAVCTAAAPPEPARPAQQGHQRSLSCLSGNICRHLLPLVQCPTLIVHGEKDPLVPRFHADYIHEHVRGSRLHLMPEGKHNLHLRFADEFNKLAEDFLCNSVPENM